MRAEIDGTQWRVGGPNMLDGLDLEPGETLHSFAQDQGEKGHTVVYLVRDKAVVAAFAMADRPREDSREAVKQLREEGISVVMMTGDSEDVARAVAEDLGIEEWFAGVLPENKDDRDSRASGPGPQGCDGRGRHQRCPLPSAVPMSASQSAAERMSRFSQPGSSSSGAGPSMSCGSCA